MDIFARIRDFFSKMHQQTLLKVTIVISALLIVFLIMRIVFLFSNSSSRVEQQKEQQRQENSKTKQRIDSLESLKNVPVMQKTLENLKEREINSIEKGNSTDDYFN